MTSLQAMDFEHFGSGSLDRVLDIHDECLRPDRYLVVDLPNFTGFQYFCHYLLDKPNLDINNIPKKLADYFQFMGYKIFFCDYVGILKIWGASRLRKVGNCLTKIFEILIKKISQILANLGFNLRGQAVSPTMLIFVQKLVSVSYV